MVWEVSCGNAAPWGQSCPHREHLSSGGCRSKQLLEAQQMLGQEVTEEFRNPPFGHIRTDQVFTSSSFFSSLSIGDPCYENKTSPRVASLPWGLPVVWGWYQGTTQPHRSCSAVPQAWQGADRTSVVDGEPTKRTQACAALTALCVTLPKAAARGSFGKWSFPFGHI